MKFTIHKLRVGDLVRAHIVECVGPDVLIVSFQGDLVRVNNKSHRGLRAGDKILVRVTQISPLLFQLVENQESSRGATRINLQV
jgi:hypothetical protein